MSYKIEITADSISELTGKLLALAAATQPSLSDPVMAEVKDAAKPKKAPKGKAEETSANTAAGIGSSTVAETAAQSAEDTSNASDTGNVAEDTTTGSEASSDTTSDKAPPSDAAPLDFDKDVAPIVLEAVKVRTKAWVQDVLAQFGVERASQVADAQMHELVALLKAGLE